MFVGSDGTLLENNERVGREDLVQESWERMLEARDFEVLFAHASCMIRAYCRAGHAERSRCWRKVKARFKAQDTMLLQDLEDRTEA